MSLSRVSLLLLPACVVQEIDLRGNPDNQPLELECDAGERYSADEGCVSCTTLADPVLTCPCSWQYEPAGLPYCDTPEAFYRCLPCTGDIESCSHYDGATATSSDCFLLSTCCEQLAAHLESTPCCQAPDELRCVLDAGNEPTIARVGCLPADCCSPPCNPGTETCDVTVSSGELVCVCNEVIAP